MRKRNHVIPVRLNAKELRFLEEQVEKSGLPREEYIRSLVMGGKSGQDPVSIIRISCGKYPVCATRPTSLPMSPTAVGWQGKRASGKCSA